MKRRITILLFMIFILTMAGGCDKSSKPKISSTDTEKESTEEISTEETPFADTCDEINMSQPISTRAIKDLVIKITDPEGYEVSSSFGRNTVKYFNDSATVIFDLTTGISLGNYFKSREDELSGYECQDRGVFKTDTDRNANFMLMYDEDSLIGKYDLTFGIALDGNTVLSVHVYSDEIIGVEDCKKLISQKSISIYDNQYTGYLYGDTILYDSNTNFTVHVNDLPDFETDTYYTDKAYFNDTRTISYSLRLTDDISDSVSVHLADSQISHYVNDKGIEFTAFYSNFDDQYYYLEYYTKLSNGAFFVVAISDYEEMDVDSMNKFVDCSTWTIVE